MTRSVFLDVGAHWGETIEEVLSPLWRFDLVYAFEPDPACVAILESKFPDDIASGRLVIVPAALSNRAGAANIYGDNAGGGASLYADKRDVDASIHKSIALISSSEFFAKHLNKDDLVLGKLNCEGGEIDILSDLLASGEIQKIDRIVVDFDIRKVRGKRHVARGLMNAMRRGGFNRFFLTEDVMIGPDHQQRMRNALALMPEAASLCADPAMLPSPPRRPKLKRRLKAMLRYL